MIDTLNPARSQLWRQRHVTAVFVWFVAVFVCGVGSYDFFNGPGVTAFIILGTALLTSAYLAEALIARTERAAYFTSAVAFVLLLVLIGAVFKNPPDRPIIFIDLLLVFMLSAPALMRIWSWKAQVSAGAAGIVLMFILWFGRAGWASFHSFILVGVGAVLSAVVAYNNIGQASFERPEAESQVLTPKVWGTLLLQFGLLAIWLFYDIAFKGVSPADPAETKIYALFVLTFAALLLRSLPGRFWPPVIVWATIGVAGCVSYSSALLGQSGVLPGDLFPLVYLALSTVQLPWSLSRQISVAWGIIIAVLAAHIFAKSGMPFMTAADELLRQRNDFFALLAIGTSLSAVVMHLFASRRTPALPQAAHKREDVAVSAELRNGFEEFRVHRLLISLFAFGLVSNAISTLFLSTQSVVRYEAIAGMWTLFALGWWSLNYLSQKKRTDEVWFLAAVLCILGFVWPATLFVFLPVQRQSWIFFPCLMLFGLGFVPWRARELFSLLLVVLIAGFLTLGNLGATSDRWVMLALSAVAALTISVKMGLRLRIEFTLKTCPELLQRQSSAQDCVSILGEALSMLFCADRVVTLTMPPAQASDFLIEARSASLSWYHWLPDSWLPVAAPAKHGWVVELRRPLTDLQPLFVPARLPLSPFFQRKQIDAALVVIALTVSGMELLVEREKGAARAKQHENALAEREYEFSAMVHDINNTVQDLTVLCEGVLEDNKGSDGPVSSALHRIVSLARSMATVVSDAKRRRELERMKDLTPRESIEVRLIFRELISFARLRAERRRISVESAEEGTDEIWIRVSAREHFETILRNLLNNAILYSDHGSSIKVRLAAGEEDVTVEVSDQGPGLAEEERELIFSTGVRGRAAQSVGGGLGLGLAQSRRVAESAGGSITALPSEKGATFVVKLPRLTSPMLRTASEPWALLIDDQPSLTDFYALLARGLHLLPAVAHTICDAKRLIEERGRPTLVLTDLEIGDDDGLELIRFIRSEFGASLPILVVSAGGSGESEKRAREAGATDYIAKPVGRRALFARLQSLL